MKILKDFVSARGRRTVTIELDRDEEIIAVKPNTYVRLGGQTEDVVGTHVVMEMRHVYWCSINQAWVDA